MWTTVNELEFILISSKLAQIENTCYRKIMEIHVCILKHVHQNSNIKMCTWWSQNKNELKRKKKDACKNICNVLRGDLFWKKRFFMNILDGNAFMGLEK